jgi:hypothetical protein
VKPHWALVLLCLAAGDGIGPLTPSPAETGVLVRLPLYRDVETNRIAYWANPAEVNGLVEGTSPDVCTVEMDTGSSWTVALSCEETRRLLKL